MIDFTSSTGTRIVVRPSQFVAAHGSEPEDNALMLIFHTCYMAFSPTSIFGTLEDGNALLTAILEYHATPKVINRQVEISTFMTEFVEEIWNSRDPQRLDPPNLEGETSVRENP
jgi:hypothetical protein